MKGTLFKNLLVTAATTIIATAITFGGGKALSAYAEDAPQLTSYDLNGDGDYDDEGEANWGYALDSAEDLYWFSNQVNNGNVPINALLKEDITVNGNLLTALITVDSEGLATVNKGSNISVWTPIGTESNAYKGTFDGAGHTISGLYFDNNIQSYVGLFGCGNMAFIKNVTVADSYFRGSNYVGGVCGSNSSGVIINCTNAGIVTATGGGAYAGGVCGYGNASTFTNCTNAGAVTATGEAAYAGGLCGYSSYGAIIENCTNAGAVTATGARAYAGGVCGKNFSGISKSYVQNCTNSGSVTTTGGGAYAGGVCAMNYGGSSIVNSINTGEVNAKGNESYLGGVCGRCEKSKITSCTNSGSVIADGKFARAGGVSAANYDNSVVNACINTGVVTVNGIMAAYIAGVSGYNEKSTIQNCYNTGVINIDDSFASVGSVCADIYSSGTITNCYYLETVGTIVECGTAKTAEQFASGEVCWLLNTGINPNEAMPFCQNLSGEKDASPVLDDKHGKVYKSNVCVEYSNIKDKVHTMESVAKVDATNSTDGCEAYWYCKDCGKCFLDVNGDNEIADIDSWKSGDGKIHNFDEDGFCTVCNAGREQPSLVPDTNDIDDNEETNEVYEIKNACQLYWFVDRVNNDAAYRNANAYLAEDITVNSNVLADGKLNDDDKDSFRKWTPIGNKSSAYCGTFDGAGHTISGLYFSDDEKDYVGLFGYINDGSIKNVTVADSYFCSSAIYSGGVCGYCKNGTIENCVNKGAVTSSYDYAYVGGVCGMSIDGNITKCTNMGAVTSTGDSCYVGGVCVWSTNNTITNCTNVGLITAKDATCVGGVSAYNDKQSMIADCINTGAVTLIVTAGESSSYIGGISAYNRVRSTIANCFSTGAVTINGDKVVGGSVCAYSSTDGKVTNCYFLKTDGLAGVTSDYGTAKTDEQFASGEVCWLLNGGANQPETPVFFQNLGTNADAFPVFDNSHSKVYKSDVCVEYSNIKDKKHTINPVAKVNATCETDGCEAYWYCSDCKTYFADKDCKTKIADLEAWKSKDGKIEKGQHTGGTATCTEKAKCEICGEEYGTVNDRHTGGTATCTEKAKCEICGAEYGTVEGHKYAETWNFDAENHWHECEVCHDKKDVAAHTLVTTATNAGIGAEGKIETVCTDCNNIIKTDLIPAIATVKLSQTSYTYNKKAQKPSVIVTDSEGTVIANTNYTVKYSSGRKKVGKYKVTVTFTGNYTGSVELTFTINPPKTSISKLKAGKKSFTVNWSKKTTEVTGYQIQYSTSSKFKTKTKTVTVKSAKDVKKTINKLSGNKKYYVRVRTYKTVGKTKYYSEWSEKKLVKTKK